MRLEVRFWIADPMNGVNNVRSDVNRAIYRIFRENGVKIPVAQRELRILDRSPNTSAVRSETPSRERRSQQEARRALEPKQEDGED
jgi:small-conductance mechanosensitive channel